MKTWKCKKCGGDISGRDVTEQSLDVHENGSIRNIYNDDTLYSYYICDSCGTQTKVFEGTDIEKLKEIAYLVEEEEK